MRRKFTRAVVTLVGIAAFAGAGATAAQAADGTPVKVANFKSCKAWGEALQADGKIKGFHCDNMNDAHQWYLTPVY
ncbi:hypothetical protein [Streptomyces iconiensis]|uniref:Secreted protein n=1 Tax=Streptomyces iconiensis TaxID=1384038 RepID=A0ABT6ZRX2_9ACTN|nr:hypothetical protein [Streptomyces iconiensis]MDJ1131800.1 hypothetical protein [Streptomyces iconiensis]